MGRVGWESSVGFPVMWSVIAHWSLCPSDAYSQIVLRIWMQEATGCCRNCETRTQRNKVPLLLHSFGLSPQFKRLGLDNRGACGGCNVAFPCLSLEGKRLGWPRVAWTFKELPFCANKESPGASLRRGQKSKSERLNERWVACPKSYATVEKVPLDFLSGVDCLSKLLLLRPSRGPFESPKVFFNNLI